MAVEASRQARQYDRYVLEYEQAAELDDDAAAGRRGAAGDVELLAAEADRLREEATTRAFASGVFGGP